MDEGKTGTIIIEAAEKSLKLLLLLRRREVDDSGNFLLNGFYASGVYGITQIIQLRTTELTFRKV